MKPYKGIVRIACINKVCKEKHKEPVAHCINCEHALIEVVDFENKVIVKKRRKKKIELGNRGNGETEKK